MIRERLLSHETEETRGCWDWEGRQCVTMTLAWCSWLQWADYRTLPANNVDSWSYTFQPFKQHNGGQTRLPVLGSSEAGRETDPAALSLPPRPPPQPGVSLPDAGPLLQLRGLSEECLLHVRYFPDFPSDHKLAETSIFTSLLWRVYSWCWWWWCEKYKTLQISDSIRSVNILTPCQDSVQS